MMTSGRDVTVWVPRGRQPAPVVLFSHGFGACPAQSTFMAKSLADNGYWRGSASPRVHLAIVPRASHLAWTDARHDGHELIMARPAGLHYLRDTHRH